MELADLRNERFDIGRAAILRFAPIGGVGQRTTGEWDGTVDLFASMEHIGTTEGPVDIESNAEFSDLTIEVTGPAILKSYLSGEAPTFEIGVFPDPDKMRVFSPTGTASAGVMRRQPARLATLWLVAEELFLAPDTNGRIVEVAVTHDGTEFLKDGVALTPEEQDLVDMSLIIWKARLGRATPRYAHEDGGKSLRSVPIAVLQDFDRPNGAQLWLAGSEIEEFELDFTGTGS
jgi:hypothetical protein